MCWGFFTVNDNLLVDVEKPQMLRCIICRREQVDAFDLCQHFTLRKGLFKYGKINGITLVRTHVEYVHPKLVVRRKLAITKKLIVVVASHSQQYGNKRSRPSGCVITSYFGATNPYKKFDKAWQQFLEDLIFYICEGYRPLSTCDNIWLKRLVLYLYPCVVFPSWVTFVEEMLLTMVKKPCNYMCCQGFLNQQHY